MYNASVFGSAEKKEQVALSQLKMTTDRSLWLAMVNFRSSWIPTCLPRLEGLG